MFFAFQNLAAAAEVFRRACKQDPGLPAGVHENLSERCLLTDTGYSL